MSLVSRGGVRRRRIAPPGFGAAKPTNIALRTKGPRKVRLQAAVTTDEAVSNGMYPVYSLATVYGMQLGVWNSSTTPELVAKLYRYPNLTSSVATLSNSINRSWQEELSETGSGEITLMADDPNLSLFEDDGDDIIVFTYRGKRAFAMLAEQKRENVVSENEEGDETVTYSGRGLLALFERVLVYPTSGVGRKPVEEDRPFNWTSPSYDDSSWGLAGYLGSIREMCNVAAFLVGKSGEEVTTEFPNEYYTSVLWAPGANWLTAPFGKCYFRQAVTIAETGQYRVYLGADDAGTLFIDGQEVTSVQGFNWFGVSYADIDLTAGTHMVSAVIENRQNVNAIYSGDPGYTYPGKFAFQIYQLNILLEALPENLKAASSLWLCKCAPYPPNPPGMTVGKVLRLCIQEAQARGYLGSLQLKFSDTYDSDGRAWPVEADIATKTGTDVLTFMRELSATYCDLWMDPNRLKLWAWRIDGRGSRKSGISVNTPTSASDPNSGNILNYERESEFLPVGAFLLRWKDGWAERTKSTSISAYGRREALLEIGAPTSIEEIYRLADKQFKYFADPRTTINTRIAPVLGGDEPYIDYLVGDSITTPDGTERVLAITMQEDQNTGIVFPTLTLRNIILGKMERAWQALRKIG